MATAPTPTAIEIPPLDIRLLHIRLIGDTSLICHAWSHKAKKAMLDKQMKKAKGPKEAKDPEQDFKDSLYPMPNGDGFGFPSIAFKAAAVSAANDVDGIKTTQVRRAFHIDGELVRIHGSPTPREDMVRVGMGTADIRYRGEFTDWSVDLAVKYNAGVLSAEQIINLFNMAGFGVGVGEWRSQKDGSHGLFHVATEADMKEAA